VSSVYVPANSIGYTGDGFYRSNDPTNSIKVMKEMLQKKKKTTKTTNNVDTKGYTHNNTASPLVYNNMG